MRLVPLLLTCLVMGMSAHHVQAGIQPRTMQRLKVSPSIENSDCGGKAQSCVDCATRLECVKISSVFRPLRTVACPSASPYCSAGACVATPDESCQQPVPSPDVAFVCNGDGYYPDPANCRRYWMCVGDQAYQYDCKTTEVYNHTKAMCVAASSNPACPTASCSDALVGVYQKYAAYPEVYYVCRDAQAANALVGACPTNYLVDVNSGTCVLACLREGRLAHENNDTMYYECTGTGSGTFSQPVSHACPKGSTFDETQQRCLTHHEGENTSDEGFYEDYYIPDSRTPESVYNLPANFKIGAASAAYQVEGAWNVSDKTLSIWDVYYHARPTMDNGDVADNSYYQYMDDVAALKELQLDYYRLSISWPRLLPHGDASNPSADGTQYYHNVLDALIKENIEPMVTLYHWDLPQEFQDDGGWLNAAIQDRFVQYASYCFKTFGDKVKTWILVNEPLSQCALGYESGTFAPGIAMPGTGAYRCSHNMVLAHAKAYREYEKTYKAKQNGRIGSAINMAFIQPTTSSSQDRAAAERYNVWQYAWFADPLMFGDYPAVMRENIDRLSAAEGLNETRLPRFTDEEKTILKGATDFLGMNNYNAMKGAAVPASSKNIAAGTSTYFSDADVVTSYGDDWAQSARDSFPVTPWSLGEAVKWVSKRYNNFPIWVTENGFCGARDEGTADRKRIGFYSGYMRGLMRAINQDKCNVIGYTAWSLADNLEWNDGFNFKFGIVHVNFTDPQLPRTIKDSGSFFRLVLSTRYVSYVSVV